VYETEGPSCAPALLIQVAPTRQFDALHCVPARTRSVSGYPDWDRGVSSRSCRPISACSRSSIRRECSGFPVPIRWGCPLDRSSVRSTGSL